jgi:uncharacterized protein YdhG (YjbR/CyaY superfamily)
MNSISEYIKTCPQNIQMLLEQMYAIIKHKAPQAQESISYGMPTFKMNGKPLVYFAGFKNTLAFMLYPQDIKNLLLNFQGSNKVKAPFSFHLTNRYPLT